MKGARGSRRHRKPSSLAESLRAVVLVGFMGAGKTSVGRALSARLGWPFVDLDDRVQTREGRTIAEIFRESGEPVFRQAEHAALCHLLAETESRTPVVLALGGGAFILSENRTLVGDTRTPTVFLDASAEELWKRCSGDSLERPLRRDEKEFWQLYEQRRPRYRQARFHIQTGGHTVDEIADQIVAMLSLQGQVLNEEK